MSYIPAPSFDWNMLVDDEYFYEAYMSTLEIEAATGFGEPSLVPASFVQTPSWELATVYPTFEELLPLQTVPPLEPFPEQVQVQPTATPVARVSTRRARGGHNRPAATGYAAMMVRSFQTRLGWRSY
jgi:hypothetical protein